MIDSKKSTPSVKPSTPITRANTTKTGAPHLDASTRVHLKKQTTLPAVSSIAIEQKKTITTFKDNVSLQNSTQGTTSAPLAISLKDTAGGLHMKIDTMDGGSGGYQQDLTNRKTVKNNYAPIGNLITLDFGPQGLGLGAEKKLTSKLLLHVSAGIGACYVLTPGKLKYRLDSNTFGVYVSINPRWYYKGTKDRKRVPSTIIMWGVIWVQELNTFTISPKYRIMVV